MLVVVAITTLTDEDRELMVKSLVDAIVAADLSVISLYLQFNDNPGDSRYDDHSPLLHVYGKTRLPMPLLGLSFEIGPVSFFQANNALCPTLFETAIKWLRPEQSLVLDICCGVGTIGLCVARHCRRVVGVELEAEMVEAARDNARLNGINNTQWIAGKAEEVMPKLLAELSAEHDVCAIVDPPRAGLHKRVLEAIRKCKNLSRMVYVSCNPDTLAEDVVRLTAPRQDEDCFVPTRAVGVDMFPHTFHCEMVLMLERGSTVTDPRNRPEGPQAADWAERYAARLAEIAEDVKKEKEEEAQKTSKSIGKRKLNGSSS
eukprot:gnl/TRDRNA2_/TRDRNA2_166238_c0_seq2.p1 gnl/TRDRNA2_/TRDRNA2_166238_c0~~gnl/TRDRNA2_/TRDRNA2_166238_c0_seq2.p1  ORF type:complete len:339 (+),score=51.17 gnl/TRDRNA2_/TRDRNA2_166238_c0_seq2:72-1019(+)